MKKQKKIDFLQILASHATKNKYLIMISTASNYQYSMHMSEVIYHIKGMLFMLMFVSHPRTTVRSLIWTTATAIAVRSNQLLSWVFQGSRIMKCHGEQVYFLLPEAMSSVS